MSDPASERALLQRLAAGPVSGDVLAREAGLTRAAVWKRIDALRDAGIAVDAVPRRGYRLAQRMLNEKLAHPDVRKAVKSLRFVEAMSGPEIDGFFDGIALEKDAPMVTSMPRTDASGTDTSWKSTPPVSLPGSTRTARAFDRLGVPGK
mgnify:CR=1 FL=1